MWSPVRQKKVPAANGEALPPPVSRIAEAIIKQAVHEKSVGIQLLPVEEGIRVEYLKDGAWAETMLIPKPLERPLTEHFKAMAGLPLGYRMALQGLILLQQDDGVENYDVHLFVMPTRQGEKVVMQIEEVPHA